MSHPRGILLIADDEEMNKAILTRRLRREGFETIDAADGAEAVAKVRELGAGQLPCAVLMDINMPVMDGIEATRIIKEEFRGLPIIAVTACVVEPWDYSAHGFDELCRKPLDFEDLLTKIRRFA